MVSKGPAGEWDWLRELRKLGPLDADFVAAVEEEVSQQHRPALDEFFR
jgi:antitoxin VapB